MTSIINNPGVKELVESLSDPSYLPIDRKDLNSRRLDMISSIYEEWYSKVLKDQPQTIHRTFAMVKASKVIYGHTYSDDVENTVNVLDDSVKKLIMKT